MKKSFIFYYFTDAQSDPGQQENGTKEVFDAFSVHTVCLCEPMFFVKWKISLCMCYLQSLCCFNSLSKCINLTSHCLRWFRGLKLLPALFAKKIK